MTICVDFLFTDTTCHVTLDLCVLYTHTFLKLQSTSSINNICQIVSLNFILFQIVWVIFTFLPILAMHRFHVILFLVLSGVTHVIRKVLATNSCTTNTKCFSFWPSLGFHSLFTQTTKGSLTFYRRRLFSFMNSPYEITSEKSVSMGNQ